MMQIYKIGIPEIAIAPIASRLKSLINEGSTAWFLSGGSNIELEVAIMNHIDAQSSNNLTLTLADERFGAYDHPESNWHKLRQAGFDPKNARIIEIIQPNITDIESTTSAFESNLTEILEMNSYLVGQFGMGDDGHIAGILPNSLATQESDFLATHYTSSPYNRITLTFNAIRKLDVAFLIANGENKKPQLENLINYQLPLSEQPAQIIKQVAEAYLYNDQIEGSQ